MNFTFFFNYICSFFNHVFIKNVEQKCCQTVGENIDIKLLGESNQTENLETLSTQPRILFQRFIFLYPKHSVVRKRCFM